MPCLHSDVSILLRIADAARVKVRYWTHNEKTVQQAARHIPAIKARVRVLTDILLGWALDPALPDGARSAAFSLSAA